MVSNLEYDWLCFESLGVVVVVDVSGWCMMMECGEPLCTPKKCVIHSMYWSGECFESFNGKYEVTRVIEYFVLRSWEEGFVWVTTAFLGSGWVVAVVDAFLDDVLGGALKYKNIKITKPHRIVFLIRGLSICIL